MTLLRPALQPSDCYDLEVVTVARPQSGEVVSNNLVTTFFGQVVTGCNALFSYTYLLLLHLKGEYREKGQWSSKRRIWPKRSIGRYTIVAAVSQ